MSQGQRHFRTPAGVIAVYAAGDGRSLMICWYPIGPGTEVVTGRVGGADAAAVARSVVAGDMPGYVFADWLEERGMPGVAAMIRHPDTTDR